MWYGNYSPTWRAYEVDPKTWTDGAEIGAVQSLDVVNDTDSETLQDGSLKVDGATPSGFVRIYLEAVGEGLERVPVGTFRAVLERKTHEQRTATTDVSLVSLLDTAATVELPAGFYAPKGADPVRFAADLIRQNAEAPVERSTSGLALASNVVAESNETPLTFARALLEGTGYAIRLDERGVARVTNERAEHVLTASNVYDQLSEELNESPTLAYKRPFDPAIKVGDLVRFELWEQGVTGAYTVASQRIADGCEVDETAVKNGATRD